MDRISGAGKKEGMSLGINCLGRIGKLTLWHHVSRKYFNEIIINMGRKAGGSISDLAHFIERDSTYGPLHAYLYGHKSEKVITDLDDALGWYCRHAVVCSSLAIATAQGPQKNRARMFRPVRKKRTPDRVNAHTTPSRGCKPLIEITKNNRNPLCAWYFAESIQGLILSRCTMKSNHRPLVVQYGK